LFDFIKKTMTLK